MSSGISIESGVRLKPDATKPDATKPDATKPDATNPDAKANDGFQAWHFFVLASILLATVTVFITRRSSPEQLILVSLTIAAAGAVAAAFYRMLLPLVSANPAILDEPLTERRRAALEREKLLALRAIKELEFDRAMEKLSQKDFDEMAPRLRQRAVALMKQLDAGVLYREAIEKDLQQRMEIRLQPEESGLQPEGVRLKPDARGTPDVCPCGTANDVDAVFCKKCGTRLQAA